mgnify:CR=1 FL=1
MLKKARLHDNHFGHGTPKFWHAGQEFWARFAWFTRQNYVRVFQRWFLERTPETRTALLKFMSSCAYLTAFHIWFQARFRCAFASWWMSDSRVQKPIVSLVALKKRKRLSQFRDETRSSLAPLLHALKRRQRPAASYSGLSKSSTLKRGASILLKYFHCLFFFLMLCHSHFFYFGLFPFCTFVSVLSFCLWLLWQWTHYPWIEAVPDTRKDFNH